MKIDLRSLDVTKACRGPQVCALPAMKFFVVLAICLFSSPSYALIVADNKSTDYTIVVSDQADEATKFISKELSKLLFDVTGAKFSVLGESEAKEKTHRIFVGPSQAARTVLPEVPWDDLASDELIIKAAGNDLVLAGGQPRGTIYAVYEFLEKQAGIRWWHPRRRTVPKLDRLDVGTPDIRYLPPFAYRCVFSKELNQNLEFAVKLKQNGSDRSLPDQRLGGDVAILGWCHTFAQFVPPSEFSEHPEWGGLVNGQRIAWTQDGGQPCLSSDGYLQRMTEAVMGLLKEHPEAKVISVSQNDNNNRCECPLCLAVEKEEGSPSGPIIRFVNKVAREVAKTRPDVLVHTLAYTYSAKPPLLEKPDNNVMVCLTVTDADYTEPYASPRNADFQNQLEGWSKISSHLFVWDYVGEFAGESFSMRPNWLLMPENIAFLAKYPVWGVFMQADYGGGVDRLDFQGLRSWVGAQLLWNPKADAQALVQEYLSGNYGAAGPSLYEYLKIMTESIPRDGRVAFGWSQSRLNYDAEIFHKADAAFDRAESAVAENAALLRLVRIQRLTLEYAKIKAYAEGRWKGEVGDIFPDKDAAVAACQRFVSDKAELRVPDDSMRMYYNDTAEGMALLEQIIQQPIVPLPAFTQGKVVRDFLPVEMKHLYPREPAWLKADPKGDGMFSARLLVEPEGKPMMFLELPKDMEGKIWTAYAVVRYAGAKDGAVLSGFNFGSLGVLEDRKVTKVKANGDFEVIELGAVEPGARRIGISVGPDRGDTKNPEHLFIQRIFLVQS